MPLNGSVQTRSWSVRSPAGGIISEGTAPDTMSPLDYFLTMFPMRHLQHMVTLTNERLVDADKHETSVGEVLKYFGTLIMMTRFSFNPRR